MLGRGRKGRVAGLDLNAAEREAALASVFPSIKLKYSYWPTRGLLYSFLTHEVVFFAVAFLSVFGSFSTPPGLLEPSYTLDPSELAEVIYLPAIGGGAGSSRSDVLPEPDSKESDVSLDPGTEGLAYPGPQPILSDPPEANDSLQTLLQPELEEHPILESPLSLPNIVQIAGALTPRDAPRVELVSSPVVPAVGARMAPDPLANLPDLAESLEASQPSIEVPVLDPLLPVPITPTMTAKGLEPPELDLPELAPSELPEAQAGLDSRNLLAVSPVPGASTRAVRVPEAEAGGRFAVVPGGDLDPLETEPGGNLPNSLPFVGFGEGSASADGEIADNIGVGNGVGDAEGNGLGDTPDGLGSGSGTGAGTGNGQDLFSGITIVGDGSLTGAGRNQDVVPVDPDPAPLPESYGFQIISTETSGGGLPYFGVFENEQVHTVYLDMRSSVTEQVPSWTLEFGVPQLNIVPLDPSQKARAVEDDVELPRPTVKKRPVFPEPLAAKYQSQMMIVYGIIHVDGRFVQLSVKQSPDRNLNGPLLEALNEWVFQPAQFKGQPIPVKILMGIPVWPFEEKISSKNF